MPFPGAAASLAEAFGVRFISGSATDSTGSADTFLFRRRSGTLVPYPVSDGRTPAERVDSALSITGQAFSFDPPLEPILLVRPRSIVLPPEVAWQFSPDTPSRSADGLGQGVVGEWGRGRVAFWGKAAMFSAQVSGEERRPMGMNQPEARQDAPLLVNLVRWLTSK
jgi:hypothetical protein